jgi:hypothetical protein
MSAITHGPAAVSSTRSNSAGDLRTLAADNPPKTDFTTMWTIKFGHTITQVIAPENTPVHQVCDRAGLDLGLELKRWETQVERRGGVISVRCTDPRPVQASKYVGNQEGVGKINSTYTDIQLVREAQVQLGIEGEWKVRTALTLCHTRTIEAERVEENREYPALPKDSDLVFAYHGTRKTAQLKAGASAWDQAQAAQRAFGETLLCVPIEETGDVYTIQVYRQSVYPITFVKEGERVKSWVGSTKIKVATEETRRLFGEKPTLELLAEPGIVYQVKTSRSRSSKPQSNPESNTRAMTEPGIRQVVAPSMAHRRNTPQSPMATRSQDGRDIVASGKDRATDCRGCSLHVLLPQKTQTIKGLALARDISKADIAALVTRQLNVDLLHSDYLGLAPDD